MSEPESKPSDDGVVESDWSPYTFTMNWKIVRPEVPVHFKKGDAVCFLQPFPLDLLERFDCSLESYDSLPPDVQKGFQDFVHRRSAASAVRSSQCASSRSPYSGAAAGTSSSSSDFWPSELLGNAFAARCWLDAARFNVMAPSLATT